MAGKAFRRALPLYSITNQKLTPFPKICPALRMGDPLRELMTLLLWIESVLCFSQSAILSSLNVAASSPELVSFGGKDLPRGSLPVSGP